MNPIYYPINNEAAQRGHEMKSFQEFRSDEPSYQQSVDEVFAMADAAAERAPQRADEAYRLADKFSKRYADWLNEGYRIDQMCPSVMIAGSANFPTGKKEKQIAAYDRHMAEWPKIEAYREKIQRIGTGHEIIKCGDSNAVELLRSKVERLEADQERMKEENRQARIVGDPAPHPTWELTNNRQNLNSAKKRLKALEVQKEAGTKTDEVTIMGESVKVIENTEIMRLQLVFDGKPSDDVRAALKKHGFRWSPKNEAWQRQLTDNARYALRSLENIQS